jgi:hypothetical protein
VHSRDADDRLACGQSRGDIRNSKRKTYGRRCNTPPLWPTRRSAFSKARQREIPGRHGRVHHDRASAACGGSRRRASPRRRSDSPSGSRDRRQGCTRAENCSHIRSGFRGHPCRGRTDTPSVIIFRLGDQTPASVNPRLFRVIDDCAGELASGAIVIVEEQRYRVRRLPIRR